MTYEFTLVTNSYRKDFLPIGRLDSLRINKVSIIYETFDLKKVSKKQRLNSEDFGLWIERNQRVLEALREDSCPIGAISMRHFHLRAERCLTFHNESKNDWPSWIHPEWHHCVVGCLQCQRLCPENKKFLGWIEEKEEFSAEETELPMWGCPFEELPKTIQEKLDKLSLTEYYPAAFSRNLRCLFDNSSSLHRNGRLDIERNIYQRGERPWSKNRR